MATPFSLTRYNGVVYRFGEYYGSDNKVKSTFISWQKTHPTPYMTNRSGGWRSGSNSVVRKDKFGSSAPDSEYNARSQVVGLPAGSTLSIDYDPVSLLPDSNNVINCVRNKVKNGSINMPVFAAEATQGINMVSDAAKRIGNSALAVASGRFGKAAQILGMPGPPKVPSPWKRGQDGLRDNWLSYRYGWMPLLSDVDGAVDALTRPAMSGILAFARCKRPFSFEKVFTAPGYSQVVSVTGYVSAGVYYECKNSTDFTSLGLSNPAEVAWELVPYSFVVDWFIPIGKALSALDAFTNVTVLASYVNKRYHSTSTNTYSVCRSDKYYCWSGVSQCLRNGMVRTVDNYGGSVVSTQIPRVNFAMNDALLRFSDAVALLHGAFGRGRV